MKKLISLMSVLLVFLFVGSMSSVFANDGEQIVPSNEGAIGSENSDSAMGQETGDEEELLKLLSGGNDSGGFPVEEDGVFPDQPEGESAPDPEGESAPDPESDSARF